MAADDRHFITDAQGRFTIRNVPRGKLMLRGMPQDPKASEYTWLALYRVAAGTGTIDLGDLPEIAFGTQRGPTVVIVLAAP